MEGYFEFTKPQKDRMDLLFWINWFDYKKIKTAIIAGKEGKYILLVEGKDHHNS